MESRHRLVLTRRHYDLVKDIDVNHIVDQLIQDEIIDIDVDLCIITAESTPKDKARKLLSVIPSRGPKAYDSFLKALNTTYKHLKENLETCEKEIQDEWTETVKEWLLKEYGKCSNEEESTTINDVLKFVNEKDGNITLHDDELCRVITEAFGTSVIVEGESSNATVYLTRKLQPTMEFSEGYKYKAMRDWSVSDVRFWLKSIEMPEEVAEWFYYEHWAGVALRNITKAEIRSLDIPHLKSGDVFKIIQTRDDVLSDEKPATSQSSAVTNTPVSLANPTQPAVIASVEDALLSEANREQQQTCRGGSNEEDICRQFGSSETTEKQYRRDEALPYTEGKKDRLMEDSHLFVDEDLSTPDGLFQFAYETLQFACACLNDRTNGTIHFGVTSQQTEGSRPGVVKGTRVTKRDNYQKYLKNALQRCFIREQHDIISACVLDPTFVSVKCSNQDADVFVVEVHVIPNYDSCRDEAFFVQMPQSKPSKGSSLQLEKPAIFRWNNNKPLRIAIDKLDSFMKSKRSIANKRKLEEQKQHEAELGVTESFRKKLVRLFCHGDDAFIGETYPILVINKPEKHMNESFLQETMSFVNKIKWKAVFDFDAEATVCKFFDSQEERMSRVVTTDDFDPDSARNVKNPGRMETMKEGIRTSSQCPWIFSNGHKDTENDCFDPINWNKEKRIGFRKAVDFFVGEIPRGRAMIVYLLLSSECDVMLEAAQEFHTMFRDQYMCVAENADTWIPWKEEMVHRKCESAETLDDRAVIGIPWKLMNQTFEMLIGPNIQGECRLPSSSGTYVTLKPHILQRLEDLNILSANECENSKILEEKDAQEKHKQKTEELFYRGNKVDWWNFHFSDHVLRRDKQEELTHALAFELNEHSSDRNRVHTVKLVHEPGSGGTTAAMQTLWDFRKKYRCAVVTKISSHTARQIMQLHSYEDMNPQPILLLLDNPDEENAADLRMELEIQSRRMTLGVNEKPRVTCVFLECVRTTKIKGKHITLRQKLSEREIEWFEKANSRLEETYSEDAGVHPKQLISFNIMRKNFDPEYIKAKVKEVIGDIDRHNEKTLLKYVALINAFEVGFDPLPIAAFDMLMNDRPFRSRGKDNNLMLWETKMSSALGILINEVSNGTTGYSRSLRMASPLLSTHVLDELRRQEDGKEQSLSDLAQEFFKDNSVFKQTSQSQKTLNDIVKTMLVRRERLQDGRQVKSFAPLIQTICDNEGLSDACIVIELGYQVIQDAFIAQQISRLHITLQNWHQAHEYAKCSTDQINSNSYLWDTYGRVYLCQVEQELAGSKRMHTMEDIGRIVEIALKGIDKYQKGQKATEIEKHCNEAVYLNELKLTMKLLFFLSKANVFKDEVHMYECLVGGMEMPKFMVFPENVCVEDYTMKLTKLHSDAFQTIVFLDDRNLQISYNMLDGQFQRNHEHLGTLKSKYYRFFVKPIPRIPRQLPNNEQDRRRRLFEYESYALGNIFEREEKDLLTMKKLVQENVNNPCCTADDLRILISVNLVLSVTFQRDESVEMYERMSHFSCDLYKQRHKLSQVYLEAYLFYVMFNWPRDNTKSQVPSQALEEPLIQWRDAFFRKYPKAKDANTYSRNRPTTKFFLANGRGMKSIFCYKRADKRKKEREEFWRSPDVLENLQRFCGILVDDGCYVTLGYDRNERSNIKIPTSFPIRFEYMWNKPVFFVVGFSWDGPKAFDVDCENPASNRKMTTTA